MKAFVVQSRDSGFSYCVEERSDPLPAPGEVVVSILAAGVTPTELQWYPTTHREDGTARVSAIPCHEFSGTLQAVGASVDGFAIGDRVYGMNAWFSEGAAAELCVSRPEWLAVIPQSISAIQAAAVPISLLTAHEGLISRAHLRAGERVLIHGAAGAVGLFAVQIAVLYGAEVVVTASASAFSLLRSLGAHHLIDYSKEDFEQVAGDIDVVFDAVGRDMLVRSKALLREGGRMVTIAADAEGTTDELVKQAFFIVEPKGEILRSYETALSSGSLKVFVKGAVSLDDAQAAFDGSARYDTNAGKGVIAVR